MSAPEIVQAPAKLTLRLSITGVRADGYHLIDAVMASVDLYDTLSIDRAGSGLVVRDGDADIPLDGNNLVSRALALTGLEAGIELTKCIPSQAGLGGGSADAGAVLRWAGYDDLAAAASIGADVAFCAVGGRARVRGIGEIVDPLPFVPQTFTLMTPPVPCSTPKVYAEWDRLGGPKGDNGNDLEPAALSVAPELARYRDELEAATNRRARLAGSGSTWFVEGSHPGESRVVVRTVPRRPAKR